MKDFYKNSLYAGILGDALGVPVESTTRQELALCSVKNMLGYGRYDLPEGTWSDDTSLTLATIEGLLEGYSPDTIAQKLCGWLFDGKWTPYGYTFDTGITTVTALESIRSGEKSASESGMDTEDDNGNGSLVRMLPVVLYFINEKTETLLNAVHDVSKITHAHPRALVGCGIYTLFVRELNKREQSKKDALKNAVAEATRYYNGRPEFKNELQSYMRIITGEIIEADEDSVYSSGYIVDSLEASIWAFFQYNNTKDILFSAVNLGLSTDTNGAIAGSMAGIYHGLQSVPEEWIDKLANKKGIDKLINDFMRILK